MPVQQLANPAVSWLSERAWQDILGLSTLKNFSNLAQSFPEHLEGFKKIFDSSQPHRHVKPNTVLTHSHFAPSFVRCRSCECLTSCAYVCIFAEREPLPGAWDVILDSFQKLLVLRCLRADCLIQGLQDFVAAELGQRFIEPQVKYFSRLKMHSKSQLCAVT